MERFTVEASGWARYITSHSSPIELHYEFTVVVQVQRLNGRKLVHHSIGRLWCLFARKVKAQRLIVSNPSSQLLQNLISLLFRMFPFLFYVDDVENAMDRGQLCLETLYFRASGSA
jgi:hypothetical protein